MKRFLFSFDNPGKRIKKYFRIQYIVCVYVCAILGAVLGCIVSMGINSTISSFLAEMIIYAKYSSLINSNVISLYDLLLSDAYQALYSAISTVSSFILIPLGTILCAIAAYYISSLLLWLPFILLYGYGELIENTGKYEDDKIPSSKKTKQAKKVITTQNNENTNFTATDNPKPKSKKIFKNSFSDMSDEELIIIYLDQKDLFTEDEIAEMENELLDRGILEEDYYSDNKYIIKKSSEYIDSILEQNIGLDTSSIPEEE